MFGAPCRGHPCDVARHRGHLEPSSGSGCFLFGAGWACAVLALRRLAGRVEAEQVALARDHGWSWQQIAEVLGMTRQSVHAKYGGAR